jgi:hypothetical protein
VIFALDSQATALAEKVRDELAPEETATEGVRSERSSYGKRDGVGCDYRVAASPRRRIPVYTHTQRYGRERMKKMVKKETLWLSARIRC